MDRRLFLRRALTAAGTLPLVTHTLETRRSGAAGDEGGGVTTPKVLSHSIVFKHPSSDPYDLKNQYGLNHAASVTTLPDGRLLVSWFSGPFEASVHQLILASYSSDKGLTWTPATVLQNTARKSDFDPAWIAEGKRTWFFYSVGRWNPYPSVRPREIEIGVNSFKLFRRYSEDSGRTWSQEDLVLEKIGMGCRSNGIRLSTGELLLPIHGYLSGVAGVLKSANGGKTWNRFGEIKTDTDAHEPSIAELPSGDVIMVLRTGDGRLWQTFSKDKGETWMAAEKTNIVAARTSHNIFRLQDARIVLTHNASETARTPLTMRISADEGKTWGQPVIIASVPVPGPEDVVWTRQVSYPSVTAVDAENLVVVWGEIYKSNEEQWGDIHAARVLV